MRNRSGYKIQDARCRIRDTGGFTLVELMVTMAVFVLVIAGASGIFTSLLNQFKQQSKITETNIEGIITLDILRQDIEHAGLGLPWVIPAGTTYLEADSTLVCGVDPSTYNDSTTNPPRAVNSGNDNCTNNSDYLVIKSARVARNWVAGKWTYLRIGDVKKTWRNADGSDSNENVNREDDGTTNNNVRVIVINPGSTTNLRSLVVSGDFYTRYNNTSLFAPTDSAQTNMIYGIDPDPNPLRMPFNRADYYISTANIPQRCAAGTGVLVKAIANHGNGDFNREPLLDCVANMQVVYGLDITTPLDGALDCYTNDLAANLAPADAANIRDRVVGVRVYILAHEGQYDSRFTFNPPIPPSSIRVGEAAGGALPACAGGGGVLGRDFNLSGINNWQNYRWKVYTLVVKPENLR